MGNVTSYVPAARLPDGRFERSVLPNGHCLATVQAAVAPAPVPSEADTHDTSPQPTLPKARLPTRPKPERPRVSLAKGQTPGSDLSRSSLQALPLLEPESVYHLWGHATVCGFVSEMRSEMARAQVEKNAAFGAVAEHVLTVASKVASSTTCVRHYPDSLQRLKAAHARVVSAAQQEIAQRYLSLFADACDAIKLYESRYRDATLREAGSTNPQDVEHATHGMIVEHVLRGLQQDNVALSTQLDDWLLTQLDHEVRAMFPTLEVVRNAQGLRVRYEGSDRLCDSLH